MHSSNARATFIARANARARDDNPSILHRPRTVYMAFGQFQRISVGTSDKTIRISVVLSMRETPYRKALVTQYFFRKIKHLATNNTFSHGYLMSTVASYFDFETRTAETESESAALLVQCTNFSVNNMEGDRFTDNRNKIVIVDPSKPVLSTTTGKSTLFKN